MLFRVIFGKDSGKCMSSFLGDILILGVVGE